jgi:putative endonuclease
MGSESFMQSSSWFTYIVQCSDKSLYTGITKNVKGRVAAHNSENCGAKYTRSRRPVQLVHVEEFPSRSLAAKREYELKKMKKGTKEHLIMKSAGRKVQGATAGT